MNRSLFFSVSLTMNICVCVHDDMLVCRRSTVSCLSLKRQSIFSKSATVHEDREKVLFVHGFSNGFEIIINLLWYSLLVLVLLLLLLLLSSMKPQRHTIEFISSMLKRNMQCNAMPKQPLKEQRLKLAEL